MGSEWQELDALSHSISDAQHRVWAAEAVGNSKLARDIHHEIEGMEMRQSELLSAIASSVVGSKEEACATAPDGNLRMLPAPELHERGTPPDREEMAVWNRLTPADIDRAWQKLETQRAETLARHAAELTALDAERMEVDQLEEAIDAFMRKFGGAELVPG